MRSKGLSIAASVVALIATSAAPSARAEVCGVTPTGASAAIKATLQLEAAQSGLTKAFGKSTNPDDLSMFFKASGCELPDHPPDPTLTPVALKDAKNIHQSTLKVLSTRAKGDELIVSVNADPKTFAPGTYKSLVLVEGEYLLTASATVEVSRSEPRFWLIGLIGVAVGLGAFLITTLTAWATGKLGLSGVRLVAAGLLVVVTAIIAGIGNYWPQTVWSFGDNIWGLIAASAAAATTSSIAGHITGNSTR